MHTIGSYIREKRLEKEISLRQLAKLAGISPAYLSQIENNYRKNPTTHVLRSIANGLGIPFKDFLLDIEEHTKIAVSELHLTYMTTNELVASQVDLYDLLKGEGEVLFQGRSIEAEMREKLISILDTLIE